VGLLRDMFGPSKEEIWGQLAADIGATYQEGGFWREDVLRYSSGQWVVTLDTYTVSTGKSSTTYTRMRAPFVNRDGLYFKVYRSGVLTGIGKALGMQDITVGNPIFDEAFVVKGNNEERIRQLFGDPNYVALLESQPQVCFEVRNDEGWFGAKFPEGVDELHFLCYGVVKDADRLRGLFDLFTATLERLVQIDSAYANDPMVRL